MEKCGKMKRAIQDTKLKRDEVMRQIMLLSKERDTLNEMVNTLELIEDKEKCKTNI